MENIDLSGQIYDFGGEEVLEVRNEEIESDGHNLDHNGDIAYVFRVITKAHIIKETNLTKVCTKEVH